MVTQDERLADTEQRAHGEAETRGHHKDEHRIGCRAARVAQSGGGGRERPSEAGDQNGRHDPAEARQSGEPAREPCRLENPERDALDQAARDDDGERRVAGQSFRRAGRRRRRGHPDAFRHDAGDDPSQRRG